MVYTYIYIYKYIVYIYTYIYYICTHNICICMCKSSRSTTQRPDTMSKSSQLQCPASTTLVVTNEVLVVLLIPRFGGVSTDERQGSHNLMSCSLQKCITSCTQGGWYFCGPLGPGPKGLACCRLLL